MRHRSTSTPATSGGNPYRADQRARAMHNEQALIRPLYKRKWLAVCNRLLMSSLSRIGPNNSESGMPAACIPCPSRGKCRKNYRSRLPLVSTDCYGMPAVTQRPAKKYADPSLHWFQNGGHARKRNTGQALAVEEHEAAC